MLVVSFLACLAVVEGDPIRTVLQYKHYSEIVAMYLGKQLPDGRDPRFDLQGHQTMILRRPNIY